MNFYDLKGLHSRSENGWLKEFTAMLITDFANFEFL